MSILSSYWNHIWIADRQVLQAARVKGASFFSQQAVEKSAKSWAIGFGMLDRQKARKSRHRTPMIFFNMLKRYKGWLSIIEEISPDIIRHLSL
jgi:hypothetical protein